MLGNFGQLYLARGLPVPCSCENRFAPRLLGHASTPGDYSHSRRGSTKLNRPLTLVSLSDSKRTERRVAATKVWLIWITCRGRVDPYRVSDSASADLAANPPSPFSERISRPAAPDSSHFSSRRQLSDSLDPSTSPLAATGQHLCASPQTALESRR